MELDRDIVGFCTAGKTWLVNLGLCSILGSLETHCRIATILNLMYSIFLHWGRSLIVLFPKGTGLFQRAWVIRQTEVSKEDFLSDNRSVQPQNQTLRMLFLEWDIGLRSFSTTSSVRLNQAMHIWPGQSPFSIYIDVITLNWPVLEVLFKEAFDSKKRQLTCRFDPLKTRLSELRAVELPRVLEIKSKLTGGQGAKTPNYGWLTLMKDLSYRTWEESSFYEWWHLKKKMFGHLSWISLWLEISLEPVCCPKMMNTKRLQSLCRRWVLPFWQFIVCTHLNQTLLKYLHLHHACLRSLVSYSFYLLFFPILLHGFLSHI